MYRHNKLRADGEVKWCINFLIESFFCRMFEAKKGKLYLCFDHHRYLEWRRESPRALIGKTKMKDGYYYQTHKLK